MNNPEFFGLFFKRLTGWYSTVKIEYTFMNCCLSFLSQQQGNYKRSGAYSKL